MTKYSLKAEDQKFVGGFFFFFLKRPPFESVMHRRVTAVGCEVGEFSLKICPSF